MRRIKLIRRRHIKFRPRSFKRLPMHTYVRRYMADWERRFPECSAAQTPPSVPLGWLEWLSRPVL